MRFEPIAGLQLALGESPVWDARRGQVFLCDILNNRLIALGLDRGFIRDWVFDAKVCSLGLCESGRLVIALEREVILFDPETGQRKTITRLEGEPETSRYNDGKVGPDGAFWVGTMDGSADRQPISKLYRIAADGDAAVRKGGLIVSNGLAWSPDGRAMYHSDSAGKWIDRHEFDLASGEVGEGRRIAEPGEETGRPDGGATDNDGFYWSAGVSAGRLNRFAPDGRLVEQYDVPALTPTMPCFCGPDLRTLLVTSHRHLPPERLAGYPLSGSVFVASSPVAGTPVARMKGL